MPDVHLITRSEAAARTGLSVITIDRLIREGRLPSVKLGHARRIPADAVEAFLAEAGEATRVRAADATERRIRELVAAAPPLSDEQKSRLRTLLGPVRAGAAPTGSPATRDRLPA